jgi:hypothetical protein
MLPKAEPTYLRVRDLLCKLGWLTVLLLAMYVALQLSADIVDHIRVAGRWWLHSRN